MYYMYILSTRCGFAGFTAAAPGRAWSGLCLIRGSRFHTASAARQLLATVGPSARPLLEKPATPVLWCLLWSVPRNLRCNSKCWPYLLGAVFCEGVTTLRRLFGPPFARTNPRRRFVLRLHLELGENCCALFFRIISFLELNRSARQWRLLLTYFLLRGGRPNTLWNAALK